MVHQEPTFCFHTGSSIWGKPYRVDVAGWRRVCLGDLSVLTGAPSTVGGPGLVSSLPAWLAASPGGAHLLVEWKGVSVGLARLEMPQVKQEQGELVTAQDILVIENELQDILAREQAGGKELGGASFIL